MPYNPAKEKRTAQLRIRYTPTEKLEIEKHATDAGLTISEYLRRRALGRRIMSIADEKIINELRRIGGLLKHVHNESGGSYSMDTASALSALKMAISRIGKRAEQE